VEAQSGTRDASAERVGGEVPVHQHGKLARSGDVTIILFEIQLSLLLLGMTVGYRISGYCSPADGNVHHEGGLSLSDPAMQC
jgi:hypothetical protein